ncbi:MAG: fused MFS/spermidine synthase [Phycisphaerae bacterium]|nr:fused MFS/spermidine synthase [Phycisphaerae bacterium]
MIIELVASRLIARDLGSSIYTWTSVIGIILLGITIGSHNAPHKGVA